MRSSIEQFITGISRRLIAASPSQPTTEQTAVFEKAFRGAVEAELVQLGLEDLAESVMTEERVVEVLQKAGAAETVIRDVRAVFSPPEEDEITWTHAPLMDRWIAETPSGRCTVGKVRAAGHGWAWAATLADGHRIASADTAEECKESAEYHARRLAKAGEEAHG